MTLRYQHLVQAVDVASGNSKKHKPFRILEIGVFDAAHGRQMIERAARNGRIFVEYYGFDMFEQMTPEVNTAEIGKKTMAKSQDEVMKYLRAKTKARIVKLFKGDSKKTLPAQVPSLPKMDIIFVDGGHSLGTIQSDFEHAFKLAHSKTIILLDDYYPGDFTKGCAFLVENDLKSRGNLKVEVLEPVDSYAESGLSVQFVKVSLSENPVEPEPVPEVVIPQSTPAPELPPEPAVETTPAPQPVEVPAEPQNFRAEDSHSDTHVQPPGVCAEGCGDSACEYTGQPCDGSRRCQPRVEGGDLAEVSIEQADPAPVPEERQEPDQKLELGVVESPTVEHTDNGGDEQRRDVPTGLEQNTDEGSARGSRRSRRSRNKRSRSQTETTDSPDNEGLQDN
jgi:hypothetical protein